MILDRNQQASSFYIVVLLLESIIARPDCKPLYEERFLLIKATSEEEARKKAIQQNNQPLIYQNQYSETVTWTFKEVVEAKEVNIDKLVDGTEIFARFFRNYEAYNTAFQQKFED
jgi:hypothetical protein